MIVFDFFYFCIYNFVSNKAIFGKNDSACAIFTISTGTFFTFLCIFFSKILNIELDAKIFATSLAIVFLGGGLTLSRIIFMNPKKLKSMHRRFRKIPKWLLKTLGILYCVGCFASGPFLYILQKKLGY